VVVDVKFQCCALIIVSVLSLIKYYVGHDVLGVSLKDLVFRCTRNQCVFFHIFSCTPSQMKVFPSCVLCV
jgi:hypothetical protein